MVEKFFRPMLAVDATDHLDNIKFPKYVSYKLDGIRVIFHPELGIVSRSLKPIQSRRIKEKFDFMLQEAKRLNRIFDGEFYSHVHTFQDITRAIMTKDLYDPKVTKKLTKEFGTPCAATRYINGLVDNIKFHCFETTTMSVQEGATYENFRVKQYIISSLDKFSSCVPVIQSFTFSKEAVLELFEKALEDGYEGLILRAPDSPYKFGRSTLKEEYMLKVKPFKTFDAKINNVIQATEVNPDAEKKINELGRSVTSRKKDDRIPIEKACAFEVMYEGKFLKVSIAMTDVEKEEVWKNRDQNIGRMIEYKGMMIGAKDVPRHPVFVRFREDRD